MISLPRDFFGKRFLQIDVDVFVLRLWFRRPNPWYFYCHRAYGLLTFGGLGLAGQIGARRAE